MIHTRETEWFFDMDSGKMLYTEDYSSSNAAMNTNLTYDPSSNNFFTFTAEHDLIKGYQVSIKNFKKADQENQKQKSISEYRRSRLEQWVA